MRHWDDPTKMPKPYLFIIVLCIIIIAVNSYRAYTEWIKLGETLKVNNNVIQSQDKEVNDKEVQQNQPEEEDRSGIYKNYKDEGIALSYDNYYQNKKNNKAQILSFDKDSSTFMINLVNNGIKEEVKLSGVDLFTKEVDVGNDVAINKELSVQYPIEWINDYFTQQPEVGLFIEIVDDNSSPKLVKFHDTTGKDFTERLLKYGLATPSDTTNSKYLELDQESKDTLTGFYFKPTIYDGNSSPERQ